MSVLVKSPMPGKILEYKVTNGSMVSKGDVLFVLEAMKMHNEICAEKDGVVSGIESPEGDVVSSDKIIMRIN